MSEVAVVKIQMGQIWSWNQPNGKRRTMLVQRVTHGPPMRVWGINPQSGKKMQCLGSMLVKGMHGAKLERVVEGYEWRPSRPNTIDAALLAVADARRKKEQTS